MATRLIAACFLAVLALGSLLPIAVEAQTGDAEDEASEARDTPEPGERPEDKKRRQAVAGLLIASLVLVIGVLLVVGVIVWARRLRRLNEEPLPEQACGDGLWYLKKGSGEPKAIEDERHDG